MQNAELKRLTLELSADLRAGRYEPDFDLGKSEQLGEARELQAAYEARARPLLEAYLARGLITPDELAARLALGADRDRAADRLQALEILLPD